MITDGNTNIQEEMKSTGGSGMADMSVTVKHHQSGQFLYDLYHINKHGNYENSLRVL